MADKNSQPPDPDDNGISDTNHSVPDCAAKDSAMVCESADHSDEHSANHGDDHSADQNSDKSNHASKDSAMVCESADHSDEHSADQNSDESKQQGACNLKKDDSGIEITERSSVQSENELSGTDESRDCPEQSEQDTDPESNDGVMRRRRRISSSGSETDDVSTMKPDSEESEEEMDVEPVTGEPKPRQMYQDIKLREYGFKSAVSPLNFAEVISGNLALVQRLELQYKLDQHTGCVNALHYSQNGNLLASGSDDLKVIVWDWSHQKPAIVFDSGHRNNVFQAKFLPFSGDCHIVTCARDGQVRLAELSTTGVCKTTKKLAQHKGAAHKLSLEMDSPHVFLSCGEDAATYQMDLREDKPNKLLVTKEGDQRVPIYSIHSNPCNSYEFCLAGRDRYVRLYDKRKIGHDENNATLKKFCPQHMSGAEDSKCNVTCAVFSYNGTEIIGSYNDEDIYLFDTSHSDGADFTKRYHGHRNNATVKGVNFYGPRSEYVISGSDCGNIYIWEKISEKVVQFFPGDEGGVVNVLEPHPYGPYLATSGLDSDVKIWAPTSEEPEEMKELRSTMKKNRKERRDDRMNEPDMLDQQAIWLLMQHLRRSVRRRQEANGEDQSDDESPSESDSDDAGVDQCNPS